MKPSSVVSSPDAMIELDMQNSQKQQQQQQQSQQEKAKTVWNKLFKRQKESNQNAQKQQEQEQQQNSKPSANNVTNRAEMEVFQPDTIGSSPTQPMIVTIWRGFHIPPGLEEGDEFQGEYTYGDQTGYVDLTVPQGCPRSMVIPVNHPLEASADDPIIPVDIQNSQQAREQQQAVQQQPVQEQQQQHHQHHHHQQVPRKQRARKTVLHQNH